MVTAAVRGRRFGAGVRLRRWSRGTGARFGLRLLVSYALTLVVVGVGGYFLINHDLRRAQIATYSADQAADGRSFEAIAGAQSGQAGTIRRIDQVLDIVARRPGTLEALLINRQHVIVADGSRGLIGKTDSDPRIRAALLHGDAYAGQEQNPRADSRNFEFVRPVTLGGVRYAYEVSYDHRAFDGQLSGVRIGLFLVGLVALLGGGVVFYLVGGRSLIRSHRGALERATRDGLTGLPNHRAFQDDFPQAVAAVARTQDRFALLVMDIDDFKFQNDSHGHPHGDQVLQRVAEVLRDGRAGDRPYRVGGDEFAMLLPHADAAGAHILGQRLSRAMSDAGVKTSIGVSALRPGQRADDLRAEADAALYEAKRRGGNQVAHFDDIRDNVTVTTSHASAAVRRLIDEHGITTVFQPIRNLADNSLLGLEALSRPNPDYDLSGPLEAFDIAQQIGRVHELDAVCVKNALAIAPDLPPDVLIFLNICPQTLDLDGDKNDWILDAVQTTGLSPSRIVLEITERFGGRTASIVKSIERLRRHGFKIALDDVGTGNSGLEMLRQVKAEFVKLDRSIVVAAATDPSARAVLMAMATFARQTGAYVIAEGIEDQDTLAFLHTIDDQDDRPRTIIQGGQGYELGRPSPWLPIPRDHIEALTDRQPTPAGGVGGHQGRGTLS